HYIDRTVAQFMNGAQTPAGAAEAVMEALTAETPAFRIQTSAWARGFTGTKLADQDGSAVLGMTNAWVA
ncbi:short-chain dehydrogenase, partial [Streptomyces sp. NPDC059233]